VFEPITTNFKDFCKTFSNTSETYFYSVKMNIIMRFSNEIVKKSVKIMAQKEKPILTLSGRLLEARVLKILFLYIRSLLTMDIVKIQLRTLRS